MPTWGKARARTTAAFALLALGVAAAPAQAAIVKPAKAVVSDCKDDHMTVVGAVKLTGKDARKARGATLQLQFQALPLFGLPHPGLQRTLGVKTKGSGQETFSGLGAGSWGGLLRWKFKKGGKTVLSGDQRTTPGKVGAITGASFCTLSEGLKPQDRVPPNLAILPVDGASVWHHGPTDVAIFATDDYSGVQSIAYSLDGGPLQLARNGVPFTIDTEAVHTIVYQATDVAGNTATAQSLMLVDMNPPSAPAVSKPASITASATPTIQWSPSTDSASGLKGYFMAIKRASDGALISFTPYDNQTTSAVSPQALADGETYTATVYALDFTDTPFTSESAPLTFKVDTHLEVTGSTPAEGAILSGAAKDANLSLTLDRPADPATVANSTVVLDRFAESGADPAYAVSCSSPCTTITVDPGATLPEGRYTFVMNGVKSEEGAAFPMFVLHAAVPFVEGDSAMAQSSAPGGSCALGGDGVATTTYSPLGTNVASEQGRLSFDWALTKASSWSVTIRDNNAGGQLLGTAGDSGGDGSNGPATVPLNLGNPPHTSGQVFVEFRVTCQSTAPKLTITNLSLTRLP